MSLILGKSFVKFIEIFNKHSNRFVELLEMKADKGEFDMWNTLTSCIGDLTFETLFGISGNFQYGADNSFLYVTERSVDTTTIRILFLKCCFYFFFNEV